MSRTGNGTALPIRGSERSLSAWIEINGMRDVQMPGQVKGRLLLSLSPVLYIRHTVWQRKIKRTAGANRFRQCDK